MKAAAYIEDFAQIEGRLPAAQREVRRAALTRFADLGFPDRSSERWHYTDLSPLNDRRFAMVEGSTSSPALQPIAGVDRLVFVGGQLDAASSTTASQLVASLPASASKGQDAVQSLNTAFATVGLDLALSAGTVMPRPLHVIVFNPNAAMASMSHQRHRIVLGEHAEATVVFELVQDETDASNAESLSTQFLDIDLAPGARLKLVRIQRQRAGSTLIARTAVQVGRDATLDAVTVDAGTGMARHELEIELAAPGASADVHALCMPSAKAHADMQVRIVHAAPHGRSRLTFRGIVDDRARAIFNGHIIVRPGAQKTDSEQRIASLLLSPRAEINAKPDLEIYADDVKCAHGATVGQLDETAIGYLRSRGLDAAAAKALLLRAFALEAIQPIIHVPVRNHVESLLGFPVEASLEDLLDAHA